MVLLATRISPCQLNQHSSESDFDQLPSEANDELASDVTETTETLIERNKELLPPFDKIIIWVASNIPTNLSYTVAVSTISMNIRQKYFGPMVTLGQDPVDVCKEGECLTLSHFHVNGMSENGAKPLALDVVIHGPD